jgi:hypothetical protein
MSTLAQAPTYTNEPSGWFARSEAWLDSKGKGAWIAAMVLGFIFVWPVGLALLFYMIWSKRMFSRHHRGSYAFMDPLPVTGSLQCAPLATMPLMRTKPTLCAV